MAQKKSSYEDKQDHIRKLKLSDIEVWENQYADRDYVVDLEVPEFTCICPKTGLPDFAIIKLKYAPANDSAKWWKTTFKSPMEKRGTIRGKGRGG